MVQLPDTSPEYPKQIARNVVDAVLLDVSGPVCNPDSSPKMLYGSRLVPIDNKFSLKYCLKVKINSIPGQRLTRKNKNSS